jgi:hypothetical protein
MNRLWIWLASLDNAKRNRVGALLILAGTGVLFVGLLIAHGGLLADDAGYLEWIPRDTTLFGLLSEPNMWLIFTTGHIIALVGSQVLIAGVALKYVAGHKLTWARAGFASFLAFFELVMLWGIVPSEWLNLTQGPLGWTKQEIVFTIPGLDLGVSGYFVKDSIAGGYHIASLGLVIYFAVMVQKWGKLEPSAPKFEEKTSSFGRPLKVAE